MSVEIPELLTPEEAAELLKTNKRTVLAMANRGDIVAIRVSKYARIDAKSVKAYLEGNIKHVPALLRRAGLAKPASRTA